MDKFSWNLFLTIVVVVIVSAARSDDECQSNRLVVYKVIFTTYWDRKHFPKQYPEWRPPAQWSKLVGFSHDASYHLFRLGEVASSAVQEFAETGGTEALDKQPTFSSAKNGGYGSAYDRNRLILDGFSAPPIEEGVGTTQASLFMDGNHTRVSMMSKLVPSPDWFVGLDSLNLCENGHFIDSVTVEADPLDAGTDNGFTFTSPNWQTVPQGGIFRITNVYPPHPAGSFHYPEKSQLPTIATFSFVKEKEYELSEVFDMSHEAVVKAEVLSMSEVNKYSYQIDGKTEKSSQNDINNDVSSQSDDDDEKTIVTFVSAESRRREKSVTPTGKKDSFISNDIPTLSRDDVTSKKPSTTTTTSSTSTPSDEASTSTSASRQRSKHGRRHKHGKKEQQQQKTNKSVTAETTGYPASTAPEDFFKKTYESHFLEASQVKVYRPDKKNATSSSNNVANDNENSIDDKENETTNVITDENEKEKDYEKLMEVYENRKKTGGLSESLTNELKNRKRKQQRHRNKSRAPRHCKVGPWSEWSPCSLSCGIGESVRQREVLREPKRGGRECPQLTGLKWCGSARNCRESYFKW